MKLEPYHVNHATPYSKESVQCMMDLLIKEHGDYVKKAYMAVTIFTSMRSQDCHTLRSKGCSFVAATKDNPRFYSFVLDKTKNDITGSGPVDGRTYLCPCVCMTVMDEKEKKLMAKELRKEPLCACWTPCPFNVIRQYLEVIPDPFGAEMESERDKNPRLLPLPFFRAQHTSGRRQYLKTPLGINSLYNIPKYINGRLPVALKIDRPTGHSGRHTFISNAINSGVCPEVVAKASKHKDVNSVQKYFHETTSTKLLPALCVIGDSNMSSANACGRANTEEDLSSGGVSALVKSDLCTTTSSNCISSTVLPLDVRSFDGMEKVRSGLKRSERCLESDSDDDFIRVPKKQHKGFSFKFSFE